MDTFYRHHALDPRGLRPVYLGARHADGVVGETVKLKDLLKTRTTEDLLSIIEDHESGDMKLPPAHIRAVRNEYFSRLPALAEAWVKQHHPGWRGRIEQ